MLTFVTCDCCFHLSFARQHSLMWNISQGCTTGTPAPMHGPPFAMFVRIVCLGSHLTASPVKVSTNTLKTTHVYYHKCETQKGSLFHVFHFKFGVSQHVFVITGWKIKRFLALAHTPVPVLTVSASPHTNDRSCAVELSNNKKVKWNNVKLVLSWQ